MDKYFSSWEVPNILKRDFKASDVEEDNLWVCKGD